MLKSGLKFIGFFFVFLITGILVAGLMAGSLEVSEKLPSKYTVNETYNMLADTSNLNFWMRHMEQIKSTDLKDVYDVYLKTGKPELAKMSLLIEKDSSKHCVKHHLSNKGSELIVSFTVIDSVSTWVDANYNVKGKGWVNKIVLSMLKKSLKEQYTQELINVKKQLNQ